MGKAEMVARRIATDLVGDSAVDTEIMEVSLGITRIARSKSDRDGMLMRAALLSLSRHIEQYREETGIRHPEYETFLSWLEARETGHGKEVAEEPKPETTVAKNFTSSVENLAEGGNQEDTEFSSSTP